MKAIINLEIPKEIIEKAGQVVLKILENKAKNDQLTLQQALETLKQTAKIENILISNVNINTKK